MQSRKFSDCPSIFIPPPPLPQDPSRNVGQISQEILDSGQNNSVWYPIHLRNLQILAEQNPPADHQPSSTSAPERERAQNTEPQNINCPSNSVIQTIPSKEIETTERGDDLFRRGVPWFPINLKELRNPVEIIFICFLPS
jgi:hypothetical protein